MFYFYALLANLEFVLYFSIWVFKQLCIIYMIYNDIMLEHSIILNIK